MTPLANTASILINTARQFHKASTKIALTEIVFVSYNNGHKRFVYSYFITNLFSGTSYINGFYINGMSKNVPMNIHAKN